MSNPDPTSGGSNTDDRLAAGLVTNMQKMFGKHEGYRTTHAKGLLVEGTFTPTEQAKTLSTASHFNNPSTPVIARFSVGSGLPLIDDADKQATPKGIAIRFKLENDAYTDLIAHSFNGFATRTPEDFLEFLSAVLAIGDWGKKVAEAQGKGEDASKELAELQKAKLNFATLLGRVPSLQVFADGDRPNPHNYGTITYYQPNTHVLTNQEGKITNARYRLIPEDGDHLYAKEEAPGLPKDYLEDDLHARFPGKPIVFTINAHIADPNDILDDATTPYKSTTFIPVGKLVINKVSDDNDNQQQQIAFSPVPDKGGVTGIACSKDPLIQARKGVYKISSDQRRSETRKP